MVCFLVQVYAHAWNMQLGVTFLEKAQAASYD